MTEHLKHPIQKAAEILPPEQQDQLAEQLLELLEADEAGLMDFEMED